MKRLAPVSAIALAAALTSPAALAQSAIDALTDTIVVTATKKANAENVQDVPLSVTAYGDEQLDALKVRTLQSLTTYVPNVALDDIGTTRGTANFSVRGLGINSSIPSIDPAVGTFTDGVYLGINAGVVLDIFDLESIEVLRGPQGILFGRNVTGGAVLINTKRPGNEFEASFKGAVESGLRSTGYNYYAMGAVGGPIIQDVLSARVSGYYNDDQGWHRNYFTGVIGGPSERHGKAETWLIRPSVLFTPTDNFELLVRYEHGESEGDGPSAQNHVDGLGRENLFFSASRDSFDFAIDEPGFYDQTWDYVNATATLDVAFGEGTITNIFGWRDYTQTTRGDIDATPLFGFHSGTVSEQDQISNEIRYNGTFFNDVLDVTLGFYYFQQDIVYAENRFILFGSDIQNGGGIQDQSTLGIFGQFDIALTDRITLNLGGRFTDENKEIQLSQITTRTDAAMMITECGVDLGTCPLDFTDEESWQNFTPKVGIQWDARDDLNVYLNWSQGVRSGGYNLRSTSAIAPEPFDEETVNAVELGFKAQPEDSGLQLNGAIFYSQINNMQREINVPDPVSIIRQIIDNTADATIYGVELEARYAVTDNLLFLGSIGVTDGEYDEVTADLNDDGVIDDGDLALDIPRLAPFTYAAGFVHSYPLGDFGTVETRANYSHRDASAYTDSNRGVLNEVDIIDASIGLNIFDGRANLSLYGRNLLNEVQFGGDSQLPATLTGGTFSPLSKGRVVGIELQLATN